MGLVQRVVNGPVTRVYRKVKLTTGWTVVVASGLAFDAWPGEVDELDSGYELRLLNDDELREAVRRHPRLLPEGMTVEDRIERGDRTVIITSGDELVCFVWYSFIATPALHPDLLCHVGPGWVYAHSGWVHRDHRGRRLVRVAAAHTGAILAGEGWRGMLGFIEIDNRSSLRAADGLGFELFGYAVVGRAFGRWLHARTPGCRPSGFRLMPGSDDPVVRTVA